MQGNPAPAGGLVLIAPAARPGVPGELVTLTFNLQGQGAYALDVEAPGGWVPVTAHRQLTVGGQAIFPVTLRVPAGAPVGTVRITVQARQNGQMVTAASGLVEVQGRSKIELSSPARLDATPDATLKIPLEIVNLGNRADTFDLALEGADTRPLLSERVVSLAPGERRSLAVSLTLGGVSPEFRFTTFLKATSRLDPMVVARTRTEAVYGGAQRRAGSGGQDGPALTVRIGTGAGLDYQLSGGESRFSWRYSLQPSLSGQLSDYTDAQANSDLSGDQARPLPSGVSGNIQVRGERWSANFDGGSGGVGVGGSVDLGAWTISPHVQYRTLSGGRRYGADMDVSGPLAGGRLSATVGSQMLSVGAASQRQDSFSARYGRPLGSAFDISLAAGLQGTQRSGAQAADSAPTPTDPGSAVPPISPAAASAPAASSYTVGAQVQQVLVYRGAAFDLTQSYGASLSGLQTIGLSGGMRAASPFLVRAAVTAQFSPGSQRYEISGLGLYRGGGGRGFGASLGGRYGFGSAAAATGSDQTSAAPQWQLSASLATPSLSFSSLALGGSVGLDATLQGTLSRNEHRPDLTDQALRLDLQLSGAALQASLGAGYLHDAPTTLQDRQAVNLSLRSRYKVGLNTFTADLGAERVWLTTAVPGDAQTPNQTQILNQNVYGAAFGWTRQWSQRYGTALDFSQSWRQSGQGQSAVSSAGLGLSLSDVFTPGLGLSLGYRISVDTARAAQPLTQAARIGLNYDWSLALSTPQAVVKAFGGLKGTEISGVLYRDDNLNGLRDPGEPALSGVTVQAGNQTSVSTATGQYRLQVSGSQVITFPKGLSAALEPLGEAPTRQIQGVPGTILRRDIGFAAVGNVNVLVYADTNRNGVQDEGEIGLPYAPVRLTPLDHAALGARLVQADSRGEVHVTMPLGQYSAALDPASLPGDLVAVAPLQATIQVGDNASTVRLGAAAPERQAVVSYRSGNAAMLARLESDTAQPGEAVHLSVQILGADKLSVRAFGQMYTPSLTAGRAELEFKVPDGTPAGLYELELSATGPDVQKSSGVRLIVTAPDGEVGKP